MLRKCVSLPETLCSQQNVSFQNMNKKNDQMWKKDQKPDKKKPTHTLVKPNVLNYQNWRVYLA